MKGISALGLFSSIAIGFAFFPWSSPATAQSSRTGCAPYSSGICWDDGASIPNAPGEASSLEAPRLPFAAASGIDAFDLVPSVTVHQQPFSRVGFGVGVSPLGIGANASIVLTEYFDARLAGNFLQFNLGRFEADGVNADAGLHLASGAAALDFYPFNAPIRLSAGLMFYNANHVSATIRVASGIGFTLNGESFYGGPAGTTPLTGVAAIAFHTIRPAPTLTFGFGKFIPRSSRHWSFPSEFGVAFTGSPAVDVSMVGTVCSNSALTMCSEISDTSNPVGAEFNTALQAKLASWRRSLGRVQIFPILSGGVSYSFDTPWGR